MYSTFVYVSSGIKSLQCEMQYDAFDLGIITTDEFTNAEILEATYSTVRERLVKDLEGDADRGTPVCVVTGFLGKVRLISPYFPGFLCPDIISSSRVGGCDGRFPHFQANVIPTDILANPRDFNQVRAV